MPRRRGGLGRTLLVVAGLVVAAGDAAALRWVRVARSGDPAPGLPDARIGILGPASELASDGTLHFVSTSEGPVPGHAVYRWSPGTGSALVFTTNATRSPLVVASDAGLPLVVDARTDLVCPEGTAPIGGGARLLVADGEGSLAPLAETGGPAPGAPGFLYAELLATFSFRPPGIRSLPTPLFGAGRHVAFAAGLHPEVCIDSRVRPPTVDALYVADAALRPTLVAREGAPAAGIASGPLAYAGFEWSREAVDPAGRLVFQASLAAGDLTREQALYRHDPVRGLSLLVRTGTPQAAAGKVVFTWLAPPVTSPSGVVAFFAGIGEEPTRLGVGRRGLWISDGRNGFRKVYETGEQAPGARAGVRFAAVSTFARPSFASGPFLDARGEVAFGESVEVAPGVYENALFAPDASGAPRLRVVGGDPAPGIPGARLDALDLLGLGDAGEIAFFARLVGPGVTLDDDEVWYVLGPDGAATRVLREGDLFDFGSGDPLPAVMRSRPLFDAGIDHVAVRLDPDFGRHSGLFYATVPEPAPAAGPIAAALVLAGLAGHPRTRTRRYPPRG
jgi:hypothetical protein